MELRSAYSHRPRFQVDRTTVRLGHRLSLQEHFHHTEHWDIVRGIAENDVRRLGICVTKHEVAYMPIGPVHRFASPGKIDLEMIEMQVGSYTGEDDIVEFEGVDGR